MVELVIIMDTVDMDMVTEAMDMDTMDITMVRERLRLKLVIMDTMDTVDMVMNMDTEAMDIMVIIMAREQLMPSSWWLQKLRTSWTSWLQKLRIWIPWINQKFHLYR